MPRGDDAVDAKKADGTEDNLQLDALGNLKVTLAGAAAITPVNIEELDGNPIDLDQGNAGAGTLRTVIADDDTNLSAIKTAVEIIDDWEESGRAKTNPIVGQAGVAANTGVIDALTQRVTMATDDTVATDLTSIKTAIELLDDLQGALKSVDTDELVTRITDSAGAEINPAKEDGNLASILAALIAGVSIPKVTHRSPSDFTAAYTSNVTLTLAGLNIVPTSVQIVYVRQVNSTLNTSANWLNGINCTLEYAANVVTIIPDDASTPFVATDEYEVGINDQDKGYDATQDAHKFLEQSPEKDWYTDAVPLVTEQDLTATEDDLGSPIDVRGTKTLILYIAADCNNSLDVDLSAYTLDESGGDEYTSQDAGFTSSVTLWSGAGTDFFHEYRMDVDGHSFIQLKAIAGTVGVLPADLTIKIGKRY